VLLLAALLVWPLAAFGGRSMAAAWAFGLACIATALIIRARFQIANALDRSFAILLGAIALQLLPLPFFIPAILSPHLEQLHRTLTIGVSRPISWFPLSIDVGATLWALIVLAGAIALFVVARTQFGESGLRRTVRLVSAIGFAVSLLAIAQAATAGRNIYWRFPTEVEGPLPFGPFVNRNHFATWVIMALPLCLGYVAARTGRSAAHADYVPIRTKLAHAIDPRTAWLLTAAVAMVVALLLSLSRSGVLALGVASVVTMVVCRRRMDQRRRQGVLLVAAVVAVLGLAWADIPALRGRVAGAQSGVTNRVAIWRETMPVVRDFWLTGTGAGTYQTAMLAYQHSGRIVFFNQAHNHYLQLAAEGGLLLIVVVGVGIVAFVRTARSRIAHDASGLVWIRIGALCGLGAVALQSLWETGLVMPANAALAAVLAAIVTHQKKTPES
jgi:O-antigen ligase